MGSVVMKVIVEPGDAKNTIATIAIGDDYFQPWEEFALPTWKEYCDRHALGLVVFDDDLIPRNAPTWKKATWQKMLIGEALNNSSMQINNVCYLDSDILVNHLAPNIFDGYNPRNIGLVSQRNGLPQPLEPTLRRLAFLRHTCYDNKYPLDSALFMSPKQIFEYHGIPVQKDYACMGLVVFNVENHRQLMRAWFDKYDRNVDSLTGGGDEPLINYEIQNWGSVSWLDYRFQALWIYEIAWKYPFLYDFGRDNADLIKECVEASLFTNYFLHFAGSWYESEMWKIGDLFKGDKKKLLEDYYLYLDMPVAGEPKGLIKPEPVRTR